MLLWPSHGFTDHASNLPVAPSTTALGTAVTAAATAHTMGNVAAIIPALAFDCDLIEIAVAGVNGVDIDTSSLLDVVADYAGGTSWITSANGILIPKLLAGWTPTVNATSRGIGRIYRFPLRIPAGAALGARLQSAVVSQAADVLIRCFGGPRSPFWTGTKISNIGTDAVNSRGALVTPGASGAYGAWTNIGAVTGRALRGLVVKAQGTPTSLPATARAYYIQFGIAGAQVGPTLRFAVTTAEDTSDCDPSSFFPYEIPEGTQLQARATSSGTAFDIDIAIHGVS